MTVHNASYLLTNNNFLSIKNNFMRKGFILIELLVVIAIIGILSSVVLASLNSARSKGSDAAIKSNVGNARAQAELYYDSLVPSTYEGVCAGTNGIGQFMTGATNAGSAAVSCQDSATGWGASAQLKSNTAQYYCVDSTGVATTTSAGLATDDITCN